VVVVLVCVGFGASTVVHAGSAMRPATINGTIRNFFIIGLFGGYFFSVVVVVVVLFSSMTGAAGATTVLFTTTLEATILSPTLV
jgi:hypothetical protein